MSVQILTDISTSVHDQKTLCYTHDKTKNNLNPLAKFE